MARARRRNLPPGTSEAINVVKEHAKTFPGGYLGYLRYAAYTTKQRLRRRRRRNPTTVSAVRCAWCGRLMSGSATAPDNETSHTICPPCAKRELEKLDNPTLMSVVGGNPRGRVRRSNPTLMLVGNPPAADVERVKKAWARFHHHAFDGSVRKLPPIPGGPSTMFALGWCDSMDFGTGDAKCQGARPLLCYDVEDKALWIVATKTPMNLSRCRGLALTAITYDPVDSSGKEDALFRHEFDAPRPRLKSIGSAARCRAALLEGGRYIVSDWIRN